MTLTPNMKTLLVAILEEVRRLEAVPDKPPPGMDRDQWRMLWRERREYEQFGVRHDLAQWLGYLPSPSESAVFSRALRNIEAMGLVLRVNRWGGSKTTHVRLTAGGMAEAERLAKEQEESVAALLSALAVQLPLDPPDDAQHST